VKRALVLLVLLLLAAQPIARKLRADVPPAPDSSRIGLGPVLGGVLTGAFRPLLMNYLYIRADILAGQGRFDEQVTLFRSMVQLYPHNEMARGYLGWELAFNSKGEAATPELAWRWAREGLDILAQSQPDTLSLWFMTQCGQSAYGLYRYAGPEWIAERRLRARALDWTQKTFGKPMHRFDAALHCHSPQDELLGRIQRVHVLKAALIDDWMRDGKSDKLADVVAELRWIAWVFKDIPGQQEALENEAAALETIAAGGTELLNPAVPEANALWALGTHRGNAAMLEKALSIFEGLDYHPFTAEKRFLRAWIEWLGGDRSAPRPPHPFDS
jgi:tetratricopeptide (TPR) repeat protein